MSTKEGYLKGRNFQQSNIPQIAITAGYDVPVKPKNETSLDIRISCEYVVFSHEHRMNGSVFLHTSYRGNVMR
jgi:hypothetical protein